MKTLQILSAAAVMTALTMGVAMAQVPAAPATAAAPATSASAPASTAATSAKSMKKFEEYKEKTLKRLDKRADEIQKKQACVNAATTSKALHACFPRWRKHHEERKSSK